MSLIEEINVKNVYEIIVIQAIGTCQYNIRYASGDFHDPVTVGAQNKPRNAVRNMKNKPHLVRIFPM